MRVILQRIVNNDLIMNLTVGAISRGIGEVWAALADTPTEGVVGT